MRSTDHKVPLVFAADDRPLGSSPGSLSSSRNLSNSRSQSRDDLDMPKPAKKRPGKMISDGNDVELQIYIFFGGGEKRNV